MCTASSATEPGRSRQDIPYTLQDGEFEGIVPVSGSSLTLSATTASGKPDRFLPDPEERQGRL